MENKQLTLPPKPIDIGKYKMHFFVRLFCSCMNPWTFALTQYPCQPIKIIVYLISFLKNLKISWWRQKQPLTKTEASFLGLLFKEFIPEYLNEQLKCDQLRQGFFFDPFKWNIQWLDWLCGSLHPHVNLLIAIVFCVKNKIATRRPRRPFLIAWSSFFRSWLSLCSTNRC